ncbi:MAG: rhodanese-like domain-containing protein, partial [Sphaerospermopsis kisseleviana]
MNTSTKQELQFVDAAGVKELIEKQQVHLIDVREISEYAGENIPGSQVL